MKRRPYVGYLLGAALAASAAVAIPTRTVEAFDDTLVGKSCIVGYAENVPHDHRNNRNITMRCSIGFGDGVGTPEDNAEALLAHVATGAVPTKWTVEMMGSASTVGTGVTCQNSTITLQRGRITTTAGVLYSGDLGIEPNSFQLSGLCDPSYAGGTAYTGTGAEIVEPFSYSTFGSLTEHSARANTGGAVPCANLALTYNSTKTCMSHQAGTLSTTWPEAFEAPNIPNECDDTTIGYDFKDGSGAFETKLSLAGVLATRDDVLRIHLAHEGPVESTMSFSFQWQPGVPYEPVIATFPGGVTIFPWETSVDLTYDGLQIDLANSVLRCSVDGDPPRYYQPGTGWDTEGEVDPARVCTEMDFGWAVFDDPDWVTLGYTEPTINPGDTLRVTVGLNGGLASSGTVPVRTDLYWRSDSAGPWNKFIFLLPGVGTYPRSFEIDVPTSYAPFIQPDIELRCDAEGQPSFYWNIDDVIAGEKPDRGEGCYASSGMVLENPISWVTGLGRMGWCLTVQAVVPDTDVLSTAFDDFTNEVFEQFPFSLIAIAVDFLDTLGSELEASSGSGCFGFGGSWSFGSAGSVAADDVCIGDGVTVLPGHRAVLLAIIGAPIVFGLLRHAWGMVLGGSKREAET